MTDAPTAPHVGFPLSFEGKHIKIFDLGVKGGGRVTNAWQVWNKHDLVFLGSVEWFTPFRKYSFFPAYQTVYEEVCMRELADFVETKTREHRAARSEEQK